MIESASIALRDWISSATNGAKTVIASPPAATDSPEVSVHFTDLLRPESEPTHTHRHLRLVGRYLISAQAKDPLEAQRLLGDILLAAADVPEYEAELKEIDPALWLSLGVPARPSFFLNIPITAEKPIARQTRVTQYPEAVVVAMTTLRGQIIGPDGIGISRAKLSIEKLQRSTYADHKGGFQLDGIAAGGRSHRLDISARGQNFSKDITVSNSPITIEFNPEVN
jgi:hypothetical protein